MLKPQNRSQLQISQNFSRLGNMLLNLAFDFHLFLLEHIPLFVLYNRKIFLKYYEVNSIDSE